MRCVVVVCEVLPLLGEDVPEQEFDRMFEEADADGSGLIDIDEFAELLKAINPKVHPAYRGHARALSCEAAMDSCPATGCIGGRWTLWRTR